MRSRHARTQLATGSTAITYADPARDPLPPAPLSTSVSRRVSPTPRNPLASKHKVRSPPPSKLLPTGQLVHVINSTEFDELRRKLRMQTASRRYRKRKKVQPYKHVVGQELMAHSAVFSTSCTAGEITPAKGGNSGAPSGVGSLARS